MTRPLSLIPVLFAPALFLAASFAAAPATAGGPAERAVTQCRAELLSRFPEGSIRSYRLAEVAGTSRGTRLTFRVTADRRYRFDCNTDADGSIEVAALNPPRSGEAQLAAGQR